MKMTSTSQSYTINFPGLRSFVRDNSLPLSARLLMIDLLLYAGVDGVCFPSQETLAKDMGVTPRHIQNLLKPLYRKGILVSSRRGYSTSLSYGISPMLYSINNNEVTKSVSSQLRNTVPLHIGNTFPPNRVIKGDNVSSKALLLFQKLSYKRNDPRAVGGIAKLVAAHGEALVLQAIEEAHGRTKGDFNVAYLGIKLADWKESGAPLVLPPKPTFVPCGECDNGYFYTKDSKGAAISKTCVCRTRYLEEIRRPASIISQVGSTSIQSL